MSVENPAPSLGTDLFGQPVAALRDRRGRPSFKKDKENQDFVAVRVAAGWAQKRIAENMGIDEKTLRKHFSRELEMGATLVDGVMLDVLMRRVREGHMPSVKQLRERILDAGPAAPRRPGRPDPLDADDDQDGADAAPPALGKKEQARRDAQAVPDQYGDIFDRLKDRGPH